MKVIYSVLMLFKSFSKSDNYFYSLIIALLAGFFGVYFFSAIFQMSSVPLHDYDEANRAEGARNMRLHRDYVSPITGGPYGRRNDLGKPYVLDNMASVWPRTERPPLVFVMMAWLSGVFEDQEIAFRLPSFGFGMAGFVLLTWYALRRREKGFEALAGLVGVLAILTSVDWWLSSQMAQLDTGLSFGMFVGLVGLLMHAEKQSRKWLVVSGVGIGVAILSKAQPAILLLIPMVVLIWMKRLSLKDSGLVLLIAGMVASPWLLGLIDRYGLSSVLQQHFVSMPTGRALRAHESQAAPLWWYLRWWLDMFRPGVFLLIATTFVALYKRMMDWKSFTVLAYIAGSVVLFSLAKNKVWWYVLPVLPAVGLMVYLNLMAYLKKYPNRLINLSLVIIIGSLPIVRLMSTSVMLAYGLVVSLICIVLLLSPPPVKMEAKRQNMVFILALLVSLMSFYWLFPVPQPTHNQTRVVAGYYQKLDSPKCLWIDMDLPYEAPMFYSKAGEVNYWDEEATIKQGCVNYLISNQELDLPIVRRELPISLYEL